MKTTALTHFIGIVPMPWEPHEFSGWLVIGFSKGGRYTALSKHKTAKDAKAWRAQLFKTHRRIANEQAARRRK